MNAMPKPVNPGFGSVAPLNNVAECLSVATTIIDRPPGVDGLGLFYGRSGYGKSKASQYVQNKFKALYIEVFEFWTKKVLAESILAELGVDKPKGSFADMMREIMRRMQDDPNRLLIIDEADKLIDKHMIEYVRDIYKGARIPVLLVGEERMPDKLAAYERCENRVTAWGMANPCDLADAQQLARIYHPRLTVADDLLSHVVKETHGVTSRVVTTLAGVGQFAKTRQMTAINLEEYQGTIFTGRAPRRK